MLVAVGVASRVVVVCCCYFWLCGTFGCRYFIVLLLCARVESEEVREEGLLLGLLLL